MERPKTYLQLPKGMEIPQPEAPEQKPVPLNLADVNYAGMIRQALADLPLELEITRCAIEELNKNFPRVQLEMLVLGEKEECDCREGTE